MLDQRYPLTIPYQRSYESDSLDNLTSVSRQKKSTYYKKRNTLCAIILTASLVFLAIAIPVVVVLSVNGMKLCELIEVLCSQYNYFNDYVFHQLFLTMTDVICLPSAVSPPVNVDGSFRITNWKFTDSLGNKNSLLFRNYSNELCSEVRFRYQFEDTCV